MGGRPLLRRLLLLLQLLRPHPHRLPRPLRPQVQQPAQGLRAAGVHERCARQEVAAAKQAALRREGCVGSRRSGRLVHHAAARVTACAVLPHGAWCRGFAAGDDEREGAVAGEAHAAEQGVAAVAAHLAAPKVQGQRPVVVPRQQAAKVMGGGVCRAAVGDAAAGGEGHAHDLVHEARLGAAPGRLQTGLLVGVPDSTLHVVQRLVGVGLVLDAQLGGPLVLSKLGDQVPDGGAPQHGGVIQAPGKQGAQLLDFAGVALDVDEAPDLRVQQNLRWVVLPDRLRPPGLDPERPTDGVQAPHRRRLRRVGCWWCLSVASLGRGEHGAVRDAQADAQLVLVVVGAAAVSLHPQASEVADAAGKDVGRASLQQLLLAAPLPRLVHSIRGALLAGHGAAVEEVDRERRKGGGAALHQAVAGVPQFHPERGTAVAQEQVPGGQALK